LCKEILLLLQKFLKDFSEGFDELLLFEKFKKLKNELFGVP